jgi:two-component system NtrC family sensor kinase
VHIHDLQGVSDEFREGQAMALRMGHRTILANPLIREGMAIGAVVIRRTEVRPFSEKQITLLQTFADQAVIAINNVRLFEEVQARTAELSEALEQQTATSEVLQVINASPGDLAPVFDAMLAKATQLCNAELGIMWTYDDTAFTIASERGTPSPSTVFGDRPLRFGRATALGRIERDKRLLHIPDMMDEEAYRAGDPLRVASVKGLGMRSWLGVPLLKEGKLLGSSRSTGPRCGPSRRRGSRCSRASPSRR